MKGPLLGNRDPGGNGVRSDWLTPASEGTGRGRGHLKSAGPPSAICASAGMPRPGPCRPAPLIDLFSETAERCGNTVLWVSGGAAAVFRVITWTLLPTDLRAMDTDVDFLTVALEVDQMASVLQRLYLKTGFLGKAGDMLDVGAHGAPVRHVK
ncbi:hypothetical protein SKAU_G00375630 [Synaphobranchus kaupii]|uniref:Uncharacterized protein n=1 Tax=Synaphobranchus kaupii TaxID=118154 RepID=A0A9Q1IG83_SYNKA|nr:hypothetical protein SKAU_G00375630 [Synaphobranchus kaupii]